MKREDFFSFFIRNKIRTDRYIEEFLVQLMNVVALIVMVLNIYYHFVIVYITNKYFVDIFRYFLLDF